ncbi:MAG TPA: YhjD/YihY/BrkB family envelope integrity protein [Actinomycetota bacterium]|nr:YhjD/YihY/BrkB family envelope integrity protein [Actinomycetota bacterium]
MQPPDESERPAGTPPPAVTPNEPAADDDAHPGRIAALREKEKALRERADETWKRVEASRSSNTGVDTAFRVYERDRDRLGPLLAAAVAFRLFLFFVPYVAFFVILAGLFSVERDDLEAAGLGGVTAQTITDVSAQPLWSRIFTLLLVAWALLLAARGMVKALRLIYAAAWELGRPVFHDTTKAALVFLGLTTAATTATGLARQAREGADAAGWVVTILVVFTVYLVTWLVACLLLPHAEGATWKAMLPGAVLFALGAQVFHLVVVIWLAPRVDNATARYGALGIAILILGGVYLIGRLIVAAAFLNATMWSRRQGDRQPTPTT